MPFDGARWAIELGAVDKTAQAFASVDRRMRSLQASAAMVTTNNANASGVMVLVRSLGVAAAGYMAVAKAQELWAKASKAADLGEQAEQLGVNTDQLQAYRFAGAQAGIEAGQMDVALTKLAKSAGTAADGNKEMIERFQQLGVKLLDAKGELRPVADLLPEVARGVLGIGSSSQRTATLMDLFGKSGAKMATVLEEVAKGNDSVVATAKAAGAVAGPEIIKAWDDYADAMKRAELTAEVTYAKIGAPIATTALSEIDKILKSINGTMDQINSKEGFWASVLAESRANGRIGTGPGALRLETPAERLQREREALEKELKSGSAATQGREAMIKADLDRLRAQDVATSKFYAEDAAGAASRGTRASPINRGSAGVANPIPKGAGDGAAKQYQSLIDGAKQYIALKDVETKSIGMSVEAAARLKHEQELLGKATQGNIVLGAAQVTELKALAASMAQADSTFASATFMDDATTKSQEFIATQEIERATLFMAADAAAAYRIEQELLNGAKAKGITLSAAEVAQVKVLAGNMAKTGEETRQAKEWVDFGKDSFKGFLTDINQGLREGANVWDVFGNAGLNALDRLSAKLMDMAVNDLFNKALGGGSGGGGGIFGGLLGLAGSALGGLLGGGGGVTAGAAPVGGYGGYSGYAHTLPGFATGGHPPVGVPYLVGERGPEVRVDGRPGQIFNRGQWGALGGRGGSRQPERIEIHLVDDMLDARIASGANVQIVRASPGIVQQANRAVPSMVAKDHRERGGDPRFKQ